MTAHEINVTRLAELEGGQIEAARNTLEKAIQGGKSYNECDKLKEELDGLIGERNLITMELRIDECRNSDDPSMIAVCKNLFYSTWSAKIQKDKLTECQHVTIDSEREKALDVCKIRKKYIEDIGNAANWYYMAEALSQKMCLQKAIELKVNPSEITAINSSFYMSKLAREIDLGKNPCSKTQMLKTLRAVISAMIGEEYASKADSQDVNYLHDTYTKRGKARFAVSCATTDKMVGNLAIICARILTGEVYTVEYRKAREGKHKSA